MKKKQRLCPHTGKPIPQCDCADTDPTSPFFLLAHAKTDEERKDLMVQIEKLYQSKVETGE